MSRHPSIDSRADQLRAVTYPDDQLLDTKELAAWLGMSVAWVELTEPAERDQASSGLVVNAFATALEAFGNGSRIGQS